MLAKLLDKFDPKADGADRSYADIYDESSKLLYEEIDYTLEGKNAQRFDESLKAVGIDYVRVPKVFWEATNEKARAPPISICPGLVDDTATTSPRPHPDLPRPPLTSRRCSRWSSSLRSS